MTEKKLFILDTNVLMHDPSALFRFQEHDVYLPMVVLEELDHGKKGLSEVARNVRQTSRFLDHLIEGADETDIENGLQIKLPEGMATSVGAPTGRLFFPTRATASIITDNKAASSADNTLIATAQQLHNEIPDRTVTIVSKDINLRIKAVVLGIHAEDYFNDRVLDDVDLLFCGIESLPENFWDLHSKEMKSWKEEGRTFYKVTGPAIHTWFPNQFLAHADPAQPAFRVLEADSDQAVIEIVQDYHQENHAVWGITARNQEQNFALNLLMDPDVDFITLMGTAGTGKTLLTLAAGLTQTLEQKRFHEIIMTRITVPVGEDIGFLPGTEEEKMTPWMGALMDNLEVLTETDSGSSWNRAATQDLIQNRIKVRSMNFMRGRTFLNRFIIVDEAQNLTAKQMKTLITRAGPGTKMVCLGNVAQIDTPYLTETSSGLTYVVDRFKEWLHSGHITLHRGERSRLADFASEIL